MKCEYCGEDIGRSLYLNKERELFYHQLDCSIKVLGYDKEKEKFEASTKVWFFKGGNEYNKTLRYL